MDTIGEPNTVSVAKMELESIAFLIGEDENQENVITVI